MFATTATGHFMKAKKKEKKWRREKKRGRWGVDRGSSNRIVVNQLQAVVLAVVLVHAYSLLLARGSLELKLIQPESSMQQQQQESSPPSIQDK